MDNAKNKFCALIMAAGSSLRMGGRPKQFIDLCGKSVLLRSLEAFQKNEIIDSIIVVTKEEFFADVESEVKKGNISKFLRAVSGANSRMDSVKAGIEYIENAKYVLVHDCARPLVSNKIICDVALAAEKYGASICGVAVKDTIKQIDQNGMVKETFDRSSLISVQTPQGFKTEILKNALNKAENLSLFTDDASVVEAAGHNVFVVQGDYKNIKITTDEDIATATGFLKEI